MRKYPVRLMRDLNTKPHKLCASFTCEDMNSPSSEDDVFWELEVNVKHVRKQAWVAWDHAVLSFRNKGKCRKKG